jgi:phage repressor protein C with HTH and peptisase S24 domain
VQSKFGLAIGRQADYVSRLVTGKKALGEKLAREIEVTLGLERGDLDRLNGYGDSLETSENSYLTTGRVPIIALENLVHSDHGQLRRMNSTAATDYAPQPAGVPDSACASIVRGPAMEPEFRDGWLIYIDASTPAKHGDFVVARPAGRKVPILRQLVIDGDVTYLRAINDDYPERMVELGDGQIIGRVIYQAKQY